MGLKIRTLNNSHDKRSFSCGDAMLDNYIQTQAKQDIKRDLSACFVLEDEENHLVVGYYTLSANSIERADFPSGISRKLPKSYLNLPTILLGRLAVDEKYKGNDYGELILMDALNRCLEIAENLGILAVVVDPIDSKAGQFYYKYGFILLPGTGKMFLPMKTVEELK